MRHSPFSAVALATCILAAAPAFAQVATPAMPAAAAQATTLTVTAEGRTDRDPDIADLSAGVVTRAPTAEQAMQENARRMTVVIAALRKEGVPERDIQTSGLNLHPQYVYRENQPPQLNGYQAVNNVSVQLRKLADVGRVIDVLVKQGANQIQGPSFRVDRPDEALDAARTEAVQKARQRAELYARAVGLKVRRVIHIAEGGAAPPQPYPMPMMAAARDVAEKSATTPVAPGQVQLSVPVTVTFELGN